MNVFFDLDGTLIDAQPRVFKLFRDLTDPLLRARGFSPLDSAPYWDLKRSGKGHAWIFTQHYGLSAADVRAFEAAWTSKIEAPEYLALDRAFAATSGVLQRLGADHRLYVVTSRQSRVVALDQLEYLQLRKHFAQVLVTEQKTTKAELVKGLGVALDAGDVLIGDTGKDIEAARELGIRAVAVLSGFRDRETLQRYTPDAIVDGIGDLQL